MKIKVRFIIKYATAGPTKPQNAVQSVYVLSQKRVKPENSTKDYATNNHNNIKDIIVFSYYKSHEKQD